MKKPNFYHPKLLPTWLLIALMKIGAKLPFNIQIAIGTIFGKLLYLVLPRFKKIAHINITKCFPEKSKTQVGQLLKQHFMSLGIGFFEVANCFYIKDKTLKKRYQIKNTHILQNALDKKKNIILLVGHFTTMMLAGRMLLQNFKFADIYRPQNNALFDAKMTKQFIKHGSIMIKAKDSKALIKTLKSGMPIWYAPDQDLGAKNSTFAPFFNIPTATINATAKLAKIKNTVVIPLSFVRNKSGYELEFSPILSNYPSANPLQSATIINHILQTQILKVPEQYLWIHRRFKTRPKGDDPFY